MPSTNYLQKSLIVAKAYPELLPRRNIFVLTASSYQL